jgi:hypothetical protein
MSLTTAFAAKINEPRRHAEVLSSSQASSVSLRCISTFIEVHGRLASSARLL